MAALNEASVQRKFANVNNTQDSIQSLSLWVLHHKAHHERIVELWYKSLKKAKISQRLTLFYICNEIVQTCRRKHAIMYKDAFKEVLKDAVLLVRDPSIRSNVGRILKIWEERKVYDPEFMEEILSLLNNVKTSSTLNSKLLAEFQPSVVMEKIRSFRKYELDTEAKRGQLSTVRLDASSLEAIKQLKDRAHGKEFSQNFEDSCVKLEEYVQCVEQEIKDRAALIESLEETEVFYDAQYGEAKIVANAYKNFGQRVNNQRKKLEEHKKGLPSPIPSPSHDAPSPGNTPPHIAQQYDNTDTVDMDLSDDEVAAGGRRRDSTTTTKSYPLPIPSITKIEMNDNRKGKGKRSSVEHGLPELAAGAKGSFMKSFSSGGAKGGLPGLDGGDNTPTKDEGSVTPTMDENEGSNPMNFLTQLLSQGQKEQKGSSDFFASLSNLTSNLKGKYGDEKEEEKGPSSWAAWKAKKEAVSTPPPPQSTPQPPGPSPPQGSTHTGQPHTSPPRRASLSQKGPVTGPPPPHHAQAAPSHQVHAPPPQTPPAQGLSPPVRHHQPTPPLPHPPLPPHHAQQGMPPSHFQQGQAPPGPPQSPVGPPPPGPQQTPPRGQPIQLLRQPPPSASSPPETPTSLPPGLPPGQMPLMNQSYRFPPPGLPVQMPGMPPGPPGTPTQSIAQTNLPAAQSGITSPQQHGIPSIFNMPPSGMRPPQPGMQPPSPQHGMPSRGPPPPGLPPPPQPPPGMMTDPRMSQHMGMPSHGMAPHEHGMHPSGMPSHQGGMRPPLPRMEFPQGSGPPQGPSPHGPPMQGMPYQPRGPPPPQHGQPPHAPPPPNSSHDQQYPQGHPWTGPQGPYHGSSAMGPPLPPSGVAGQPTSPQQGSSPTNPFEASGPRLGGPMNQGPSTRTPSGESESNGPSGRQRMSSGGSSGGPGDKPVRRITSESAGLLDATEEFIANLKRKTATPSGTATSGNSSDAMDVLNQLLFAHTSGMSSSSSKNFSDEESPPPSASAHQPKETDFRQEMGGSNPPNTGNDEDRSPSEAQNNDHHHHQGSVSKGKELRMQEDHPPRPPPPRRIDTGDEIFDRPPPEIHATKRSADHTSRRRDDSRYDRYDRDRRDYYDRYDDRHDARYDDRYDRDRYHEQYGGHPPPPKRLPLPPPPPPRPRY